MATLRQGALGNKFTHDGHDTLVEVYFLVQRGRVLGCSRNGLGALGIYPQWLGPGKFGSRHGQPADAPL